MRRRGHLRWEALLFGNPPKAVIVPGAGGSPTPGVVAGWAERVRKLVLVHGAMARNPVALPDSLATKTGHENTIAVVAGWFIPKRHPRSAGQCVSLGGGLFASVERQDVGAELQTADAPVGPIGFFKHREVVHLAGHLLLLRVVALGADAFADFAASAASIILSSAAFTSWSSLMRAKAAIRARRRTLGGFSVLSGNGSLLFGRGSGPGAACWESRGDLARASGMAEVSWLHVVGSERLLDEPGQRGPPWPTEHSLPAVRVRRCARLNRHPGPAHACVATQQRTARAGEGRSAAPAGHRWHCDGRGRDCAGTSDRAASLEGAYVA